MKLKRILATVLCLVMVLSTMSFTVLASEADKDIYEVGTGKKYATLADAAKDVADSDNDGAITYHIYGKLETTERGWLNYRGNSKATTINFVGMDDDAEICLAHDSSDRWVQCMGTDNIKMDAINYSKLTLSKPNGVYFNGCDIGHANRMFTTYMRGAATSATVTYTECVFPDGASNNQYGKTVYNDCEFYSDDYYALWIYDAGNNLRVDKTPASVEVNGGKMVADRGVKIYSEEQNGTAAANTTISGTTFEIESKPAVVSSLDGTITIEDVDYEECEYGLLEMGYLNGNPRYSLANTTVDGETPQYVASVTSTNQWGGTSTVYVTDNDYAELVASESYTEPTTSIPVAIVENETGTAIYDSLQSAIDAATAENNTITLLANIEGDVIIPQKENINIVVDGSGNQYTGTIYIHGNARYEGAETLTIQNVNFVSNETIDFISSNSTGSVERYAHNVKVTGCTFTSTNADADVVGMRYRQAYNMTVENCTFTDMHSAMWADSCSNGITIDGIETINCKNGISAGQSTKVTVMNSTIEATAEGGYGVRVDGTVAGNLTVEKTEINAYYPVVVRYATNPGYALNLNAGSDFTSTNSDGYDVVVTTGKDDAALVKPEEDINITIADDVNVNVFSSHVAKVDGVYYETLENAIVAAQSGDTIDLLGNVIEFEGSVNNLEGTKSLTFVNGTMDFTKAGAADSVFHLFGEDLTFENIKFVKEDVAEEDEVFMCYLINVSNADTDVKFNNCEFNFGEEIFSSYIANNAGGTITFTKCKINECVGSNFVYGGGALFDNCIYNSEEADIIAHNNFPSEIRNSQVVTKRIRVRNNSLTAGVTPTVSITGNSHVYAVEGVLYTTEPAEGETRNALIIVEEGSTLLAEKSSDGIIDTSKGSVVSKANTVKLAFEKTLKQEVYEIYVEATDGDMNRLSTVQATFNLDNDKMSYTLAPVDGVTLTNDIDTEDVYVFNFDGDTVPDATGAKLLIGTVTFGGYGKFNFSVTDGKVKTARFTDNIVEEYVPTPDAANEKQGKFDIASSVLKGAEVVEAKRDVKVVIAFNNEITAGNDADYNDMTVTLTGSNGEKWTGYVGKAPANDDPDDKVLYFVNTDETAEMTFNVTAGYRYTVVVEGEGYRTARYSTNVDAADEALVLTFWNNALENADRTPRFECIEKDVERSKKSVTFLAGDIAKDNIIDKYDLAAVVSYFGYDDLKNGKADYVKYDLNRDGKIDADDISYVLVSWGK